eukprot:Polyplicarium_translucidae@DN2602_c1_g1_i1.p1
MDFSLQDDPCEFAGCQRLDFRPFRCAKCAGTFCLDHRAANGHNCPAQFHVYRGRADFELYGPSAPALYRRAETHATAYRMSEIPAVPPRLSGVSEDGGRHRRESRLRLFGDLCQAHVKPKRPDEAILYWLSPSKDAPPPAVAALARRVAIMKLKSAAKGDKEVRARDRRYVEVIVDGTIIPSLWGGQAEGGRVKVCLEYDEAFPPPLPPSLSISRSVDGSAAATWADGSRTVAWNCENFACRLLERRHSSSRVIRAVNLSRSKIDEDGLSATLCVLDPSLVWDISDIGEGDRIALAIMQTSHAVHETYGVPPTPRQHVTRVVTTRASAL